MIVGVILIFISYFISICVFFAFSILYSFCLFVFD